jgi:hypothetical protein
MLQLLECARLQLVKDGLEPADKTMLQAGLSPVVDWAGNGSCGELIVNLRTGNPINGFPSPDATGNCASEMAYEVDLALFRCAPQPTGKSPNLKPPTPAAQTNAAREHLADMQSLKRAIQCCMSKTGSQYLIRQFTPYGPQGGAVGAIWTVLVGPGAED